MAPSLIIELGIDFTPFILRTSETTHIIQVQQHRS